MHKNEVILLAIFYETYVTLCNAVNKSPSAVAQAVGLSKAAVNGWKTMKSNPTTATLKKLADYFGITVEEVQNGNIEKILVNTEKPLTIDKAFEASTAEEKMDLAARLISSLSEEQQAAFIQRIMFKK